MDWRRFDKRLEKAHHLTAVFWRLILYWRRAKCQRLGLSSAPPPSLLPPFSPTSSMTFRPGSKAGTAGALKRGDTEHKVKVSPEPLSEIDRVGQPGSNSTNPCDSGSLVGLFIISRQHTRAWNIGLPRHWVLAAGGKKQGVRRRGRNANEWSPLLPGISSAALARRCPAKHLYPGPGFDSNVKSFSLILSLTSWPLTNTYSCVNRFWYRRGERERKRGRALKK